MSRQEFLDLAKRIDDNEAEISNALEADDFDHAAALCNEKVELFRQLSIMAQEVDDKESITPYLQSLLAATQEQLAILNSEREDMRQKLMKIKRSSKGNVAYQQVRGYAIHH